MWRHLDRGTVVVIVLTLILFAAALFPKA